MVCEDGALVELGHGELVVREERGHEREEALAVLVELDRAQGNAPEDRLDQSLLSQDSAWALAGAYR